MISSKAWRRALPDSSWSRSSSSSWPSRTASWKRSRMARRSSQSVLAHAACAFRARSTAASTSSASHRGTVASVWPAAGFSTSIGSRSSTVVTRAPRPPSGDAAGRAAVVLAAIEAQLRAEADGEEVEHVGQLATGRELWLHQVELVLLEHPGQHRLAQQQHERAAGAVLGSVAQVVEAVVALAAGPALGLEPVGVGLLRVAVVE